MAASVLLKNSFYISIARVLHRSLGLLGTLVVARILVPEDYGVIAACMMVQELAMRMQNIGFQQNIVTKKELARNYIDTGFFLRIGIGGFFSFLIFFLAAPVSSLLNNEDCKAVLQMLAWTFVFTSLVNPNVTISVKENNYVPELACHVLSKVISVSLTVYLAWEYQNYWALAIGTLVSSIAYCVISYLVVTPYIPKIFHKVQALDFFRFSGWITLEQIVGYVDANASKFLIVPYFTDKVMGYFAVGKNLCFMYGQEVSAAVDSANLSSLSSELGQQSSNQSDVLGRSLHYVFALKHLVILPVYSVFICYPEFVIRVLFGSNWLDMAPFLVWFSMGAILACYCFSLQTLFTCIRRTKIPFIGVTIQVIIAVALLPFAVWFDSALWLAISSVIGQASCLIFLVWLLIPCLSTQIILKVGGIALLQVCKYGIFVAATIWFNVPEWLGLSLLFCLVLVSFYIEKSVFDCPAYRDIAAMIQGVLRKYLPFIIR